MSSDLAIIQVTKASDDLLLIELVSLQLHASYGLHGTIILQPLLPGQSGCQGWALLQTMKVNFLQENTQ